MPYLSVPDAELYYEIIGNEGSWITLINGHTRSSSDFKMLARKLVENGFRCLLFDNRGSGQTRTEGPFDLLAMADDVERLWCAANVEESAVLGISMGGVVAQLVAAKVPTVTALALVSTYSQRKFINPDRLPWEGGEAAVSRKLQSYISASFAARNQLLIQAMVKQISKNIDTGNYLQASQAQRLAMTGFDLADHEVAQIRCPTLVLHGGDDKIISANSAEAIARNIRNSRLAIYADAGHLLLVERGLELYRDVIHFFKEAIGEESSI